MSTRNVLESPPLDHVDGAGRRAAAGCWKLASGRALSLRPRQHSVLEIAQGRAWVTVGDSGRWRPGPARATGADLVLQAGERLAVEPGRHVVIEAWSPADADPHAAGATAFLWDIAPVAATATAGMRAGGDPQGRTAAGAEWECAVAQPLRDLTRALAQGGRAVGHAVADVAMAGGRLAWGVARFARHRMAMPLQRRAA